MEKSKLFFFKKNIFWVVVSLINIALIFYLGSDRFKDKVFWYGLVASVGSVFVLRALVLGLDIYLSIYVLKYSEHKFSRFFCFFIAAFIILSFPVYLIKTGVR